MNITAYAIMDQFLVLPIVSLKLPLIGDISITNSALMMIILFVLFYSIYRGTIASNNGLLVPSPWQSLLETIYLGTLDLARTNHVTPYFPFLFSLFNFILLLNLMGMIPYVFTVTAHIAVTFGLALSILIGVTLIGLLRHQLDFFSMFMPAGRPIGLAPLLVLIELISYCIRAVRLSVRLAANMTSGHLLFAILSSFAFTMIQRGALLAIAALGPILVIFALTGLEIAVCLIQAYVFTLLTSIYIGDSLHLH